MEKNKYIYNIGYHTYEESEYTQLYHELKYTQKEFEEIVKQITTKILRKRKETRMTFQDIHCEVCNELKEKGFKEIKFTAELSVFGWANILDRKDWEHNREEQLNMLTTEILKYRQEINTQELLFGTKKRE